MFSNYPDIVSVPQMCQMLGIGRNSAYSLLHADQIKHRRVGKKYIIPKTAVIGFVSEPEACYNENQIRNGGLTLVKKGDRVQ